MGDYWHNVYDGGSLCASSQDVKMTIKLYPNTSSLDGDVKSGSETTTTLRDACDEVLNADSITKYWIDRFHAKDYEYPNIDPVNDDIASEFETFLTDSSVNGTDDNLKDWRGAHLLIHDGDCNTDEAGGESNDDCSYGGGAFSRGTSCYSPRPEACSSIGQGRNSVIQEPFHQFIRAKDSEVEKEFAYDCDDDIEEIGDEHSTGKVQAITRDATPMITYHVNEYKACGPCKSSYTWDGEYTTVLTSCTEDAIQKTGENPCNSQSDC